MPLKASRLGRASVAPSPRSTFIRRYFGETNPPACGICDRCQATSTTPSAKKRRGRSNTGSGRGASAATKGSLSDAERATLLERARTALEKGAFEKALSSFAKGGGGEAQLGRHDRELAAYAAKLLLAARWDRLTNQQKSDEPTEAA